MSTDKQESAIISPLGNICECPCCGGSDMDLEFKLYPDGPISIESCNDCSYSNEPVDYDAD